MKPKRPEVPAGKLYPVAGVSHTVCEVDHTAGQEAGVPRGRGIVFLADDNVHQPWAGDNMSVEVFFAREGSQRQRGAAGYTMPLAACVEKIGLKKRHWISPLHDTPRFGDQSAQGSHLDPYKHVVVKLGKEEAKASGWRAGYYRIDLNPKQAMERLGEPRKPWSVRRQP